MKIISAALAAMLALAPTALLAQSPPSPALSYGKVPTAGEWNSYFAAKQDVLRFTPLNQAGGTMSGKLNTASSTVNGAGFSIQPGIAPTAPFDGDLWLTSVGLFARVAGVTIPFASANDSRLVGAVQRSANLSDLLSLPTARTNLGAAESGANTTITSLNGLTTPLTTAQGGTGYTSLSAALDGAFSSTQGAILYRGASGWATLAPNTAGYVLTTNGTGANPSWVSAGSASTVLYTPQSLTDAQRGQTRANIYAAGLNNARISWIRQAETLAAPMPLFDAAADGFAGATGIDGSSVNATVQSGTVVNQANDPNLLALLRPDGAAGATTTTEAKGHPVTLTNASLSNAQTKFGAPSLLLNGSNGSASLGASADWNFVADFTIEGWFYFNDPGPGTQTLWQVYTSTSAWGALYTFNNNLIFGGPGANFIQGGVTAGWHFVALKRNGTTFTLGLDGTSLGTTTSNPMPTGTPSLSIGNRGAYNDNFFSGYVTQFRVSKVDRYPSALSVPSAPFTAGTSGNLDLRTVAYSAAAVPTKGSALLLVKTLAGTLTPNTNFTVGMRRDSAASWATGTVVNTGAVIGGYNVLTADDIDLTSGGAAANGNVQLRAQTSDTGLSIAIDGVAVGWR